MRKSGDKTFPNPLRHNQRLEQTCMPVPASSSYSSPSPNLDVLILSPYIQTEVRVLIKEGRKPHLLNHKQCFGLHLCMTAASKRDLQYVCKLWDVFN